MQTATPLPSHHLHLKRFYNNTKSTFLDKTLFPGSANGQPFSQISFLHLRRARGKPAHFTKSPRASLIEAPVLWAGRVCVFYALLKAGLAGSSSSPILSSSSSDLESAVGDLGFSEWLSSFQKNPEKEAADRRKLVSKWHPTTKGTLKRNYRVPSKSEGRRLLKAIAALLSEDDDFVDATSHKKLDVPCWNQNQLVSKMFCCGSTFARNCIVNPLIGVRIRYICYLQPLEGCQIRRESAHGESDCCNNVRALFVVEITAFPAGPVTERDYSKAEKLERVLRSSPFV